MPAPQATANTPPSHWSEDQLTKYFDDTRLCSFSTFVHSRGEFRLLSAIDQIFDQASASLNETQNLCEALLLQRSHSALRTATMLAVNGQVVEAQALFRMVLENAGYAFFIFNEEVAFPELGHGNIAYPDGRLTRAGVWLNRDHSPESNDRVRSVFSAGAIIRELINNAGEVGQHYRTLYNLTIDYGAHPNPQGILTNINIDSDPSTQTTNYRVMYIQGGTIQQKLCMKMCAESGLIVLDVFSIIFRERFRILGLDEQLARLKSRYSETFPVRQTSET